MSFDNQHNGSHLGEFNGIKFSVVTQQILLNVILLCVVLLNVVALTK